MSQGIVIMIVMNPAFYRYACKFMLSLRGREWGNYQGPITMLTDFDEKLVAPLARRFNIEVRRVELPPEDPKTQLRWAEVRTRLLEYSPYDTSLSIDVDALILKPLDAVWSYIDKPEHDLALALDYWPNFSRGCFVSTAESVWTGEFVNPETPQYGSGFALARKTPRMHKFFADWNADWWKFRGIHQIAMNRMLIKNGITPVLLPQVYNYSFRVVPTLEEARRANVICWPGWGEDHEALFNAVPSLRAEALDLYLESFAPPKMAFLMAKSTKEDR